VNKLNSALKTLQTSLYKQALGYHLIIVDEKILVTGSNGFLGQKVVDLLAKNDQYDVVAISKGPNRNPNQVNYAFFQVDLSDREN
jgi:hypothetical protein